MILIVLADSAMYTVPQRKLGDASLSSYFDPVWKNLESFVALAFQPAAVVISEHAGEKRLSQNPKMDGFVCRGASRRALISGGSRTAPTEGTVKSSVLRQFRKACATTSRDLHE